MRSVFLVAALLLGCGGSVPSALDTCKDACVKEGSCTDPPATRVQIFDCQNTCDANKAKYADQDQLISDNCTNPSAVRAGVNDCYNNYCDERLAANCAAAVECTRK